MNGGTESCLYESWRYERILYSGVVFASLSGWEGLKPHGQEDRRIIGTCYDLDICFKDTEGFTALSPLPVNSVYSAVDHCSKCGRDLTPDLLDAAERVMVRWHQEEPINSKKKPCICHG